MLPSLSSQLRRAAFALAAIPVAFAQNVVFQDSFTADALNPSTYPAVTPTSTGWVVATNKASAAPTEAGGVLTINMAGTSSGFAETQALFSPSTVQLLPGTYIEVVATFVPTHVLTSASDNFIVGLYNSGGSAPVSGLLNSGLSNTLTNFATGGAKGWIGFNANLPISGTPRVLTRPAQTGANNTVQDVVVDSQSTSVGYSTPAGVSASSITAFTTTWTNGLTYTLSYKLSLSADNATLTSAVSLYNGTGTTGTGTNTLVGSYTARFTGANILTRSFDALAFGWRADAGASNASNIKLSALTVSTTGGTPWFIAQPVPTISVSTGSSLNLNATVGGTVSSLQWQVSTNGGSSFTNIDATANPSAATAALTVPNMQLSDAGMYRLLATNAAGTSASSATTVSVTSATVPPTISVNPAGSTVLGGTPYTFTVTANGTAPFSYEWFFSPDNVTYTTISGATTGSYTIGSVQLANEGYYKVTVTNVAGFATSTPAQLVVNQPLVINQQPVGAAINANDNYTLSVGAAGRPSPQYQWMLNGTAIPGANASTYTITGATGANSGIYTVLVTNSAGDAVTSSGASVAVISSGIVTTALAPAAAATGIAPDTRLTLTFNQPISVGLTGQIRIYDASNATTPVDTIDLVTANALMRTLRAGSTLSTMALPVQNKTVGTLTNFNYYPITVSGNTATIYPRNNVLTYGKNYYVTIDPGVFTDASGLSFAGISGSTGWSFSTKTVGLANTATYITVAADGTGDFCTLQAAFDLIPAANTTPRTIYLKRGTYFEEVYFTAKHSITLVGEDRAQTVIVYPNNNNFNNVSGSYHRMTFQADKANNFVIANLTVLNSTPKGGSQAEALILNGTSVGRAIITNVDLYSFQDTFQASGPVYVIDTHISGDVDYMWGGGPNFFENCQLTALSSNGYYTQIRNGSTLHGNVYLNCTLDAPGTVSGMYLSRIDPNPGNFPFSEVVYLNCVMGKITGSTYSTHINAAGWLLNNTPDQSAASAPNIHFWEYNSHYPDGTPLNVSSRIGASKQLTMANDATTIANYSTPSYVLGGWTPTLTPIIAVQPVAQTVNAGSGFALSVKAFGIPAVSYQWLRNGAPIAGATDASYNVGSSAGADAGTYSVVISNGAGSVTSSVVPLVVHGGPPVIALQPANTSGLLGTTATFSVWALGDGPLSYQWSKDGNPIPGATNVSLRLTGLQAASAGSYSVAVTNSGGTTASAPAALTLATPAAPVPTLPVIPSAIYNVTTYGAVGDGVTDNTAAIQAAINDARAAGGGTIEFPPAPAAYLCGPITIYSNMNFQVDGGAILRALPFGTYPRSFTSPSHFITVNSASTNVEFSGGGVIDGDGAAWWAAYDSGVISGRPRLVQINKSTNMLFTGITCLNSPNFNLAFSGANSNVTIYGVTVTAPGDSPNTDGMDIAGTNFLVQGCSVSVGDDNIVAKPGSVFCQNMVIANCTLGTGHGVSIGGQTNVGLDGMTVMNCTFNGTSTGIRMKADPTQGGPVQNVTFTNITMTNVQYPILFYSYYNLIGSPGAVSGSSQTTPTKVNTWNSSPPNTLTTSTIPTWRNITISNFTATGTTGYSTIWGLPTADALIANVTLNNVTLSGPGLELFDATNIQITGASTIPAYVTCNALAITSQPQNRSVSVGGTVSFTAATVGASGTTNVGPTYQWKFNGVPLSNGVQPDGSSISGATTTTLTITNARATRAGSYTMTASNSLDGYNVTTSALVPNSLPVSATSSPATLTVNPLPATITLSSLTQTYDGTPKSATATTNPSGLAVNVSYAGGGTPVNAGSYAVTATLADPNYTATPATGTLVIQPAAATVTLTNLAFVYDGTPKSATAITNPAGLAVQLTYNGSASAPSNAGSYPVLATITDPNYAGSGNDTLVIAKATPTVSWPQQAPIVYGTALGAAQLNATASIPGSFTYSPAAGAILNAGSSLPLSVVFTPADSTNYNNGIAATTITVTKATALVTLSDLMQPYDSTAKTVVVTTIPAGLQVNTLYAGSPTGPVFPGQYAVSSVVDDPNYAGSAADTLTITTTALVRRAPSIAGGVDGSIQVLTGQNITLAGNAWISGDLLVPGTPTLNLSGLPTIAGTLDESGSTSPSDYAVNLGGRAVLRYLVRRIDPVVIRPVAAPPAPVGTRNVALTTAGADPGSFATIRNLSISGSAGEVVVPPGTYGTLTTTGNTAFVLGHAGAMQPDVYNLQGLSVNGGRVKVVGPVLIVSAGAVTLNGTTVAAAPGTARATAGDPTKPEWLTLALAAGGVTLNGNVTLAGFVIAPAGTVTLNASSNLTGEVMCDGLTVAGGATLVEPAP